MLTGPIVILSLKIAVSAVTLLLLASFVALLRGNYRLHGRINLVFFTLTLAALIALEAVVRIIEPSVFQYVYDDESLRAALHRHLCFSLPSTLLMPAMLYTGLTHRRRLHLILAVVFAILWTGTFITGVFFLPHTKP